MKKIALVTGAAKGIGAAIVKRFIADGFFVIGVDFDELAGAKMQKELEASSFQFCNGNISDEFEVKKIFETFKTKYKRLDVLINNAGVIKDNMIWNMPSQDFNDVINVNLKGTWLLCKEAAIIMRQQQNGRIINIASRAWLGNKGQSNYSSSKAGVVSLTRVLALELGKYNVYVNAIAPGLINTPLTQALSKEVLQTLLDAQPTKKMGKPEDVANVAAFLASDSTEFITGQVIYVDGGKSIGAGI